MARDDEADALGIERTEAAPHARRKVIRAVDEKSQRRSGPSAAARGEVGRRPRGAPQRRVHHDAFDALPCPLEPCAEFRQECALAGAVGTYDRAAARPRPEPREERVPGIPRWEPERERMDALDAEGVLAREHSLTPPGSPRLPPAQR